MVVVWGLGVVCSVVGDEMYCKYSFVYGGSDSSWKYRVLFMMAIKHVGKTIIQRYNNF